MGSPFDAAMSAADAVISGTFGEAILVTPRRSADGELKAQSADPDRAPTTVEGVFTLNGAADRLGGTRQGTELQGMSTVAVAAASVWFSADALDEIGYALQAGDLVTLTERPGRPTYAIAKRSPTDLDDSTFPLTRERSR